MKKIIGFFALLMAMPASGGWHFGEFQGLDVNIEYFDYAYKLPSGEPVYYLGSTMRYQVTLTNTGNRTFNNFQSQTTLRWVGSVSCTRSWYDNQPASFNGGDPLPGNSASGLRDSDMRKGGSASYAVNYAIPLSLCPGQGEIFLEGRHRNNGGNPEAASFRIPLNVQVRRKE